MHGHGNWDGNWVLDTRHAPLKLNAIPALGMRSFFVSRNCCCTLERDTPIGGYFQLHHSAPDQKRRKNAGLHPNATNMLKTAMKAAETMKGLHHEA
jgi:hypothetical protein